MDQTIHVRVVVIDDDEALCRRLQGWLAAQRYEVETFTELAAGWKHLAGAGAEIVLLDLRWPDVAVEALVERTLGGGEGGRYVIGMAAFPEPQDEAAASEAGVAEVLRKPITESGLTAATERALRALGIAAHTAERFNAWIGQRLRAVREARELTQRDVAEEVGITPARLSQIERGMTATSTWTLARAGACAGGFVTGFV